MSRRAKSKHWFVKIYNPTSKDRSLIELNNDLFSYYVLGYKVTPKGDPYLQAYALFAKPKERSQVKKVFRRGYVMIKDYKYTVREAVAFCKKEGLYVEYGNRFRYLESTKVSVMNKRRCEGIEEEKLKQLYFAEKRRKVTQSLYEAGDSFDVFVAKKERAFQLNIPEVIVL